MISKWTVWVSSNGPGEIAVAQLALWGAEPWTVTIAGPGVKLGASLTGGIQNRYVASFDETPWSSTT